MSDEHQCPECKRFGKHKPTCSRIVQLHHIPPALLEALREYIHHFAQAPSRQDPFAPPKLWSAVERANEKEQT
jgi:hypothetical protein